MSTLQFKSIRVFVRFGHCGIWIRMANETADVEADRQMFRDIGVTRRSTCSQWSPTGQPLTMGLGSVFYWKMLNLICFPQCRIQKREQNIQKVLLELSDFYETSVCKNLFVFIITWDKQFTQNCNAIFTHVYYKLWYYEFLLSCKVRKILKRAFKLVSIWKCENGSDSAMLH